MTHSEETAPIELAIQQMYENESLTDAMQSESAQILLTWGEQQLRDMQTRDAEAIDRTLSRLQRTMRTMNRLIEQQADLSETQMIQRLIKVAEQALQLAAQKSIAQLEA